MDDEARAADALQDLMKRHDPAAIARIDVAPSLAVCTSGHQSRFDVALRVENRAVIARLAWESTVRSSHPRWIRPGASASAIESPGSGTAPVSNASRSSRAGTSPRV